MLALQADADYGDNDESTESEWRTEHSKCNITKKTNSLQLHFSASNMLHVTFTVTKYDNRKYATFLSKACSLHASRTCVLSLIFHLQTSPLFFGL